LTGGRSGGASGTTTSRDRSVFGAEAATDIWRDGPQFLFGEPRATAPADMRILQNMKGSASRFHTVVPAPAIVAATRHGLHRMGAAAGWNSDSAAGGGGLETPLPAVAVSKSWGGEFWGAGLPAVSPPPVHRGASGAYPRRLGEFSATTTAIVSPTYIPRRDTSTEWGLVLPDVLLAIPTSSRTDWPSVSLLTQLGHQSSSGETAARLVARVRARVDA